MAKMGRQREMETVSRGSEHFQLLEYERLTPAQIGIPLLRQGCTVFHGDAHKPDNILC